MLTRRITTVTGPLEDPGWHKGTVWFENTFPLKWFLDPRSLFIKRYSQLYLNNQRWKKLLPAAFPTGSEFVFIQAEPNLKEGGLYLEFKYRGGTVNEAVTSIQSHLTTNNVRSIFNLFRIHAYEVKGRPWVEDLVSRVPNTKLHVEFYGPDLTKEALYREFRVFGRIVDIKSQPSSSKDLPRFATVEFLRKRAATSARNCIHGETFEETKLEIGYEKNDKWKNSWAWVSNNLRISIPLLLGVFAGVTFVIFDPWRVFSVTNQITGRFSLHGYTEAAIETGSSIMSHLAKLFGKPAKRMLKSHGWSEREADERRLGAVLNQIPESVILISGPKGSGKSQLVKNAVHNCKYVSFT
jgi:hypothetical protein